MRFLFLCHSVNVGGLETYILRFGRWLAQKHPEHEVSLLCRSGHFGSYEGQFREAGFHLYSMPMGYFNPLPYYRFSRLLREEGFDSVCDFCGDFGALPIVAAYAVQIPKRLIFYRSARNAYTPTLPKRCYQLLQNRLVKAFSTDILSNSHDAFCYYFGDHKVAEDSRFEVIRNGIPGMDLLSHDAKNRLRRGLGLSDGQKMVLHVGSGRWEKNHDCIVEIARQARDHGDNACFYLAGPGVEKVIGAKIHELRLQNVQFLGPRSDVPELLQIADLFLFPSLSEGQPNALLEAMMSGVPFIASDIAPIRESLPPGWGSRWLFPPDRPDQGYGLLRQHLIDNFRVDPDFLSLVDWCKSVYDQDRCFGDFLNRLRRRDDR